MLSENKSDKRILMLMRQEKSISGLRDHQVPSELWSQNRRMILCLINEV